MTKRNKFIIFALLFSAVLIEPAWQIIYLRRSGKRFYETKIENNKKINVIFRNDDLSYATDIQKESKIVNIFSKYNVVPIYAIIPMLEGNKIGDNQQVTDSLREWIQKGKIVPALHGYRHERNRYKAGEFGKLTYKDQYGMIKEGKRYLDSLFNTKVNIFCPPWNQADKNTIKALIDNNVEIFSGYLYSPAESGSKALNTTSNLFDGPMGHVNEALSVALESSYPSKHILLFHTSYDFNDNNIFKIDSLLSKLTNIKECHIANSGYLKEANLSDQDVLLYNQMVYNNKKMAEIKILRAGLRRVGFNLDKIKENKKEQYREAVWAGDLNSQFCAVKSYTWFAMLWLTAWRVLISTAVVLTVFYILKFYKRRNS